METFELLCTWHDIPYPSISSLIPTAVNSNDQQYLWKECDAKWAMINVEQ